MRRAAVLPRSIRALAGRYRLTVRLILVGVLASSALAFVMSLAEIALDYRRELDDIEERFAIVERSYLPGIVESAWVLDYKQLRLLVEGIARLPDLAHAEVRHRGETLAAGGGRAAEETLERRWRLSHRYRGEDVQIGELRVQASLARPRAHAAERLALVVLINLAGASILAAILFALAWRLVMRHVQHIARHVARSAPGEAPPPLALERASSTAEDELDRLVAGLNAMSGEIRAAQQRLRLAATVFAHATEGIVITDSESRIVAVNGRYSEITGYAPHELLERTPHVIRSGRHDSDFYARMWRTIREKGRWSGEIWNRRKNGEVRPEWLSVSEVRDSSGKVANYIGLYYDLTERVAAEQALRESEERFRTLVTAMHEGVVLRAADGRVVHANPRACELYGFAFPQLDGSADVEERVHAFTADGNPIALEDRPSRIALRTGRPVSGAVVRVRREDGSEAWLSGNSQPLFRPGEGTPYAVVSSVRDITAEKRQRDELKRLNEELERRVAERTRMLEEANRDLKLFSVTVAHDLRAPLRHISGYLGLLRELPSIGVDAEAAGFARKAADAANRLGCMVEGLLQYARLGRERLLRETVKLGELIESVRHELRPTEEGREVQWLLGELPEVVGDPLLLRLAFQNLLDNALKYTRGRAPASIEVSASAAPETVTVCIRDNGVGFDMRYAGRLFGAFERMHGERDFPGVGIGLAHVRRIVERHGGAVRFEAEPQRGAAFFVTLPR